MALQLAGLTVTALYGLFVAVLAIPPEAGWLLLVGVGGLAGLAGCYARAFLRLPALRASRRLRWFVSAELAIGTALCAMFAFPGLDPWHVAVCAIALVGALLLVGTLASWQTEPDNSFKPKPLHGSD